MHSSYVDTENEFAESPLGFPGSVTKNLTTACS